MSSEHESPYTFFPNYPQNLSMQSTKNVLCLCSRKNIMEHLSLYDKQGLGFLIKIWIIYKIKYKVN